MVCIQGQELPPAFPPLVAAALHRPLPHQTAQPVPPTASWTKERACQGGYKRETASLLPSLLSDPSPAATDTRARGGEVWGCGETPAPTVSHTSGLPQRQLCQPQPSLLVTTALVCIPTRPPERPGAAATLPGRSQIRSRGCRGGRRCKGPEVEVCLSGLRDSREANEAGTTGEGKGGQR